MNNDYVDYKERILGHLKEACSTPLSGTPSGRTRMMLLSALHNKQFEPNMAAMLASSIEIMIADEIFQDIDFMIQVVDLLAETIARQYELATLMHQRVGIDDDYKSIDQTCLALIKGTSLVLMAP